MNDHVTFLENVCAQVECGNISECRNALSSQRFKTLVSLILSQGYPQSREDRACCSALEKLVSSAAEKGPLFIRILFDSNSMLPLNFEYEHKLRGQMQPIHMILKRMQNCGNKLDTVFDSLKSLITLGADVNATFFDNDSDHVEKENFPLLQSAFVKG